MKLKDKVAIVTGGAGGIGKEISLRLAEEGANVVIFDIEETLAKKVVKEIEKKGKKVFAFKVNIGNYQEVLKAVKEVIDKFGRIDILINNAGITRDNLLLRMKEEEWDLVLKVNLKGVFNCLKAVVRIMMKQKYGRIVNISSVVGLKGNAGQVNYAASKAGIIGVTKSLAKELAPRGITVNAIAPGFIEGTPMTEKLEEREKEKFLRQIPLGRAGKPREVANLVFYLVGEEASYITGEVIRIDGGMAI
ncbi:3-oxoacyl-[acyl-carrier-protein] reductase [Candidatus Aerophobetes bacterium]|nr:3-oxoacyl-[acyl-carrier-protein] reductase [Candidatus Aerophobetes bacterium]